MQRRLTNNVLFTQDRNKIEILIPVYLRISLTRILQLNLRKQQYPLMAVLKLSILVQLLPEELLQFIKQEMEISFNSKQQVKLFKNKYTTIEMGSDSILTFIYDAKVPMIVDQDQGFMTPFDLKHLHTIITLRSLQTIYNGKKTHIRFNYMDTSISTDKFAINNQISSGQFGIATSQTNAIFSNSLTFEQFKMSQQDNKDKKLQYWQYAKYTLVLYRYPTNISLQIFLPMWCLALVNIVAFLFDHELSDKITIISLIMLGYLILIVINQNTNYSSIQINFIDINRLLMFIIVVCYLLNSLCQSTHHINPKRNLCFLFCLSLLGASIFLVIMFIFIHKTFWEPSYKKNINNKIQHQLHSQSWYNEQCDQYYMTMRNHFQQISKLR